MCNLVAQIKIVDNSLICKYNCSYRIILALKIMVSVRYQLQQISDVFFFLYQWTDLLQATHKQSVYSQMKNTSSWLFARTLLCTVELRTVKQGNNLNSLIENVCAHILQQSTILSPKFEIMITFYLQKQVTGLWLVGGRGRTEPLHVCKRLAIFQPLALSFGIIYHFNFNLDDCDLANN